MCLKSHCYMQIESSGLEPQALTPQAKRPHLLFLLLAEGSLLGHQWQWDAPIVVHGTVKDHFFKGPLHEINVFLLLEKDQRGKKNQSLDASALGDCHLTHSEMFMVGVLIVDCHQYRTDWVSYRKSTQWNTCNTQPIKGTRPICDLHHLRSA